MWDVKWHMEKLDQETSRPIRVLLLSKPCTIFMPFKLIPPYTTAFQANKVHIFLDHFCISPYITSHERKEPAITL